MMKLRTICVAGCFSFAMVTGPFHSSAAHAGPIAEADGDNPNAHVEIIGLKRAGNTITLRFKVTNNGGENIRLGPDFAEGNNRADYNSIGGVNLLDTANKKKYFVVRDQDKNCICSRGIENFKAKQTTNLWAKFPAPPETVDKITVSIPHFMPMDDVPISK